MAPKYKKNQPPTVTPSPMTYAQGAGLVGSTPSTFGGQNPATYNGGYGQMIAPGTSYAQNDMPGYGIYGAYTPPPTRAAKIANVDNVGDGSGITYGRGSDPEDPEDPEKDDTLKVENPYQPTDYANYTQWLLEQSLADSTDAYEKSYASTMEAIGAERERAIAAAEDARKASVLDAANRYSEQTNLYGRNAEILASRGLSNSGYSDYLSAMAASDKANAEVAARTAADSAIAAAEQGYADKALAAEVERDIGIAGARATYRQGLAGIAETLSAKQAAFRDNNDATFDDIDKAVADGVIDETIGAEMKTERADAVARDILAAVVAGNENEIDAAINTGKALGVNLEDIPAYYIAQGKRNNLTYEQVIDKLVALGAANSKTVNGGWELKGAGTKDRKVRLFIDSGEGREKYTLTYKGNPPETTVKALNKIATGDEDVSPKSGVESKTSSVLQGDRVVVYKGKLYIWTGEDGKSRWYRVEDEKGENEMAEIIYAFLVGGIAAGQSTGE